MAEDRAHDQSRKFTSSFDIESEMQAKLAGKYGNEGRAKSEEEQEYLEKKRPY